MSIVLTSPTAIAYCPERKEENPCRMLDACLAGLGKKSVRQRLLLIELHERYQVDCAKMLA